MKAILSVSMRLVILIFVIFFVISISLEQLNFFTKAYYKQKITSQLHEITSKINLIKSIGDYGSNAEVNVDLENGWIEIDNKTNMIIAHIDDWNKTIEIDAKIINYMLLEEGKYSLGIHYGEYENKKNVIYVI